MLFACLIAFCCDLTLKFQTTIFSNPTIITGKVIGGRFGTSIASLGDLDKDGCDGKLNNISKIQCITFDGHVCYLTCINFIL
jgi:hypothetical protein